MVFHKQKKKKEKTFKILDVAWDSREISKSEGALKSTQKKWQVQEAKKINEIKKKTLWLEVKRYPKGSGSFRTAFDSLGNMRQSHARFGLTTNQTSNWPEIRYKLHAILWCMLAPYSQSISKFNRGIFIAPFFAYSLPSLSAVKALNSMIFKVIAESGVN